MTYKEAKEKLYMEWQKFLEDNIDYAGISDAYKTAFKALEQEPKTGHWIKMLLTDMSDIAGQCSECGFIHKFVGGHTAQYNYCPNCGAKMIEPQERSDKG